ncbi:MAG TPA: hypothetical protein PLY64_12725, partial [Dokdonella sp.]|nr:hypothetical protein [Dokdonella sp.]
MIRLLLLCLACWQFTSSALARDVEVMRLASATPDTTLASVRTAEAAAWVEADAIRKQEQPTWWRLQIAPGADPSTEWIVALKETYDAELVAYL